MRLRAILKKAEGAVISPRVQQQVPSKPSIWLVAACLLAVYVIWGTTYFAIKVGIEGAPPFFLVGTRFVVAGALLLCWQALPGRPMPAAEQWRGGGSLWFFLVLAVKAARVAAPTCG